MKPRNIRILEGNISMEIKDGAITSLYKDGDVVLRRNLFELYDEMYDILKKHGIARAEFVRIVAYTIFTEWVCCEISREDVKKAISVERKKNRWHLSNGMARYVNSNFEIAQMINEIIAVTYRPKAEIFAKFCEMTKKYRGDMFDKNRQLMPDVKEKILGCYTESTYGKTMDDVIHKIKEISQLGHNNVVMADLEDGKTVMFYVANGHIPFISTGRTSMIHEQEEYTDGLYEAICLTGGHNGIGAELLTRLNASGISNKQIAGQCIKELKDGASVETEICICCNMAFEDPDDESTRDYWREQCTELDDDAFEKLYDMESPPYVDVDDLIATKADLVRGLVIEAMQKNPTGIFGDLFCDIDTVREEMEGAYFDILGENIQKARKCIRDDAAAKTARDTPEV